MKKINIIDLAVILLVIALIFTAYLKFGVYKHTKTDAEMSKIEYTFKISNIREYTANALKVGDIVYDEQTKLAIGTITAIDVKNSVNAVDTSEGKIVIAENEFRRDVTLTIVTYGLETDKAYFADRSVELKVGSEKKIETLYVKTTGMVMSIKVL